MITLFAYLENILLILSLIISLFTYPIHKKYRINLFYVYVAICLICYTLSIISVWLTDTRLDLILRTYDLSGNDNFEDDEMTEQAKIAMNNVISDTGRNLAPFFLTVIVPAWVAAWILIAMITENIIEWIKNRH